MSLLYLLSDSTGLSPGVMEFRTIVNVVSFSIAALGVLIGTIQFILRRRSSKSPLVQSSRRSPQDLQILQGWIGIGVAIFFGALTVFLTVYFDIHH